MESRLRNPSTTTDLMTSWRAKKIGYDIATSGTVATMLKMDIDGKVPALDSDAGGEDAGDLQWASDDDGREDATVTVWRGTGGQVGCC